MVSRNQTPLYLAAENAKENSEQAEFVSEEGENVEVEEAQKMLNKNNSNLP